MWIKMTFWLQDKDYQYILSEINRINSKPDNEWLEIEYSSLFWEWMAKEIWWEKLTLSLFFFRRYNHENKC